MLSSLYLPRSSSRLMSQLKILSDRHPMCWKNTMSNTSEIPTLCTYARRKWDQASISRAKKDTINCVPHFLHMLPRLPRELAHHLIAFLRIQVVKDEVCCDTHKLSERSMNERRERETALPASMSLDECMHLGRGGEE
eukprot:scaffold18014_cov96-Skeletonema_marinoi.AAC.4